MKRESPSKRDQKTGNPISRKRAGLALLLCLLLLLLFALGACKSAKKTGLSVPESNQEPKETKAAVEVEDLSAPPIPDSEDDNALREAWHTFIQAGRYRFARATDMRFSQPGKHTSNQSFTWQSNKTFKNELPVLVVDTTRNDDKRFGFVMFRPIRDKFSNNPKHYKMYWVCKDQDLSKTAINQASGYLSLEEINDDGSYVARDVEWSEKSQKYILGKPVKVNAQGQFE